MFFSVSKQSKNEHLKQKKMCKTLGQAFLDVGRKKKCENIKTKQRKIYPAVPRSRANVLHFQHYIYVNQLMGLIRN